MKTIMKYNISIKDVCKESYDSIEELMSCLTEFLITNKDTVLGLDIHINFNLEIQHEPSDYKAGTIIKYDNMLWISLQEPEIINNNLNHFLIMGIETNNKGTKISIFPENCTPIKKVEIKEYE